MPYALFNSDGTCIGMNLHAIEATRRHAIRSALSWSKRMAKSV